MTSEEVPHWRHRKKILRCIFNDLSCNPIYFQTCLTKQMCDILGISVSPDWCRDFSAYRNFCGGCLALDQNFFSHFVRIRSQTVWQYFNEYNRCRFEHHKPKWCRHLRGKWTNTCERHTVKREITPATFYTALMSLKRFGIPKDVLKFVIVPILIND